MAEAPEKSPLDQYGAWLAGLPPELAKDLVSAIAIYIPRVVGSGIDDPAKLIERLKQDIATDHALAGLTVSLTALTDFVFIDRGSPDSWARHEAMLDLLHQANETAQHEAPDDALAGWIEENRMRQPFRARMWMKEQEGWRRLRMGPLSPDGIHRWLKSKMLGVSM